MKLLFDQNLSHRLVSVLASEYPDSVHVRDVGLSAADFQQRALLYGHPPKVVWVRLGNCTTSAVAGLLRARQGDVLAFEADATAALLVLS